MDFKLLSEYLFDDGAVMQQTAPLPLQKAGRRATPASRMKNGGTRANTKRCTTAKGMIYSFTLIYINICKYIPGK